MNRGFLGLAWLPLCLLMGCSQGEIIPLSPPGANCELPLDGSWLDLSNICDGKTPQDVVWPEGGQPAVVGDFGLVLEYDPRNGWSVRDAGITENLRRVTVNDQGDLVAAGRHGSLAWGHQGHWQNIAPLTNANWNDARAEGSRVWLAGDQGSLAVGTPGASWQLVDFPGQEPLSGVCAFPDSLYVTGPAGLLMVRAAGQWLDRSTPVLAPYDLQSVVRLDDGRLVVWGDGPLIRDAEGWHSLVDDSFGVLRSHLEVRHGELWFGTNALFRISEEDTAWTVDYFSNSGAFRGGCSGPPGQAFSVSLKGELTWFEIDATGDYNRSLDPGGNFHPEGVFRLNDGTLLIPGQKFLLEATAQGLLEVTDLAQEIQEDIRPYSQWAGQALADCYWAQNGTLIHLVQGQEQARIPVPQGEGSIRGMLVDDGGNILLSLNQGIWSWDGDQWRSWVERFGLVFLTRHQTAVAIADRLAFYQSGEAVIPLEVEFGVRLVAEPEPGLLVFLNREFHLNWWEKGTGASGMTSLEPLPGCPAVILETGCETPTGALVATSNHSLVLRVPENYLQDDWELVAGPAKREISRLQALPDGGLIAIDNDESTVMYHPVTGF